MSNKLKYVENLEQAMKQLPKGAFLTVAYGERVNTMTIGWANFGVIWGRPIMTVAVRKSRYTYELIENADDFTVSFQVMKDMKTALEICGSVSGRDADKFHRANIHTNSGRSVNSPTISECDLHFECKILYSQFMDSSLLNGNIKSEYYQNDDYHVFYYGEIVDRY